ncbi:MAG: hypothetical protein RL557_66 [archaeon]
MGIEGIILLEVVQLIFKAQSYRQIMKKRSDRSPMARAYLTHLSHPIFPVREIVLAQEVDTRLENGYKTDRQGHWDFYTYKKRRIEIGYFCELTSAGIYGGFLGKTFVVGERTGSDFENNSVTTPWIAYPDVHNEQDKLFIESKSCFVHDKLKLRHEQMQLYRELSVMHPDHQVLFTIYRHAVRNVDSIVGTEKEVYRNIAGQIKGSLVLPFSIMAAFHNSDDKMLVFDYQGKKEQYKAVTSTTLNLFFEGSYAKEAEKIIAQLGLDPHEYTIERRMSPRNFSVEGNKVQQFPILWIEEKNKPAPVLPSTQPIDSETGVPTTIVTVTLPTNGLGVGLEQLVDEPYQNISRPALEEVPIPF